VQTRYIFVPAPGLTVIALVEFCRYARAAGRALYVFGLIAAVAVSAIVVRPFIRNKGLSCIATRNFALYIRNQIPPGAPVAAYAIGELAFVSEHPIVDTGGIVQPESIPYLKAHPEGTVQWAIGSGAQYYTETHLPEPGSVAVNTVNFPFIGWTFHLSLYATSQPVSLWKLPVLSAPAQSVGASPSSHP
jgi:hypothetical protein